MALERQFGDLSRHTLESLAIEGYRCGVLGEAQVREMLGLATRYEVNEFLHDANLFYDYTEEQLVRETETNRRLLDKRDREAGSGSPR